MQSGNQKGSFLSRESGTLEKLAEMTRGKSEAKTGSTAKNTNNFVFAAVSPPPKSAGKAIYVLGWLSRPIQISVQ